MFNFASVNITEKMKQKNKGGRPETDRKTPITIRLSNEAIRLLDGESNKSKFLDSLIRGKVTQVQCPCCGKIINIKIEEKE